MSETETTAAPATASGNLPTVQKAPLRSGGQVMAFVPNDLDEIWRMARMAVIGKMAPKSLVDGKNPEEATSACAVAIMAGAELGLTPLMSLRSYAVVNGRPSLWGDGIKAVVRKSGICDYIKTGHDDKGGWCEAKRKDTGEVKREDFTFAQAEKAGLMKKTGPWMAGYADIMAERRATFRCLNDLFADVLGGIANGEEAIEDGPMVDVTPPTNRATPPPPPPEDEPLHNSDLPEGGKTEVAQLRQNATSNETNDFNDDDSGVAPDPAAAFMVRLDEELAAHDTEDGVVEAFELSGVDKTFEGDDPVLERAYSIRERHLARVNGQTVLQL